MAHHPQAEVTDEAILVTGGSGFLGRLVAVKALTETHSPVVLPLRDPRKRSVVLDRIRSELTAEGRLTVDQDLSRVLVVQLPADGLTDDFCSQLAPLRIHTILHCAGCLSYFNVRQLRAGNIELTRFFLSVGERLGVRRFVYLSTAYSSGFVDGPIAETLHGEPGMDPTDYTRTKREAEHMVADSGLPYVIVRPSIVIGDSRDGRYGGKPYGVYQLWTAGEKYLSGAFPPVLHVIAADNPVNFLHQDAFSNGFWAAATQLPDRSVMHLASREEGLPSMRDLWRLWLHTYGGPREVHLYDHLDDVPQEDVDPQLQLWLDFTAVNNDIASVRWDFRLDTLDALRAPRLCLVDATLESLTRTQTRFVASSQRVQRFIDRYQSVGSRHPDLIVHPAGPTAGSVAPRGSSAA